MHVGNKVSVSNNSQCFFSLSASRASSYVPASSSSFFSLLSSAVQHFGGKCSQKQTRCTILHGDKSQITAYSKGGYAISVEWFECSAEDTGGLTFKTWRWCCLLRQLS